MNRIPIETRDIPGDIFRNLIKWSPRTSVELVIEFEEGVLLCNRNNEPAKGEWFWPGLLLRKGETFEECAHRLAETELGIDIDLCCCIGTYNHFWGKSKFDDVENTHAVNVVYHGRPSDSSTGLELDDQHNDYRFVTGVEDWMHDYVKKYLEDLHGFEEKS